MRKMMTTALVCLALFIGVHCAAQASAALELRLISKQSLPFSKPPLRIESTVVLSDNQALAIYVAKGDVKGEESLLLDLFHEAGNKLLSKSFCAYRPDDFVFPYAQAILGKSGFVCEFYPDVSSMEVYYRSAYTFDGKQVKADKKYTQKFGDAFYAQNIGPFVVKKRAHAYDEEGASPYLDLQIEYVPTGKTIKTKIWDVMFCSFLDEDGQRLWLAQKNEQGKLELRLYTVDKSGAFKEQVFEWDEPSFQTQNYSYVCSGAVQEGKAFLLLRKSNTEYTLLLVDVEKQEATARSTVHALAETDCIEGFLPGKPQLIIHWVFDETTQTFEKRLGALDSRAILKPLNFAGQAFSLWQNNQENIVTLEKDTISGEWLLCLYECSYFE